jgi:hypothetical protein
MHEEKAKIENREPFLARAHEGDWREEAQE